MNNSSSKQKRKFVLSDLVVILIFFTIVFLMFLRSARPNNLYNSCQNPSELNSIIRLETKNSFLDSEAPVSWWDKTSMAVLNTLSSTTFTNHVLLYFNPKYPLTVNCSSCFETEPCEENESEPYFYPKQITLNEMRSIVSSIPTIRYHTILIQSSSERESELPFPAQPIHLFDLVSTFEELQKENPVFILGTTYLETKIASETMVRAGFKRVHRVITLLRYNQV